MITHGSIHPLGEGMRTISLFSGCGGMDLGAERAGAEIVFANDSMKEAAMTFRRHWPEVEFAETKIEDLRKFPDAELVIGGYPCQSFSLGGNRNPAKDSRTQLYVHFARCLDQVQPLFFVAENVKGLKGLQEGKWLDEQLRLFSSAGRHGYNVNWALLNAADYGVPQLRKRVFIVGVRRDFKRHYWFPAPTHASQRLAQRLGLKPHLSHGDAVGGLPLWPTGEFYERPHDPEGHWAWYYMSRNRKARWDSPSYTILANFRHVPLHPASCTMTLTWSNLADGWKQRWDFSGEYEHTTGHPERPVLPEPRRLSWREAALIQTFPPGFDMLADENRAKALEKKFEQVGNAVPPMLAETIIGPLISGTALARSPQPQGFVGLPNQGELDLDT